MSNISTRLSADNSNFRSVMDASAGVAERAGKRIKTGLDVRAGMASIAAAVGLNITNIAQQVSRVITGMSKELEEAMRSLEASSKRAADANLANMRSMISEESRYHLLLLERERLEKRLAEGRMSPDATVGSSLMARTKAGLGAMLGFDFSGQLRQEVAAQQTADANEQAARLAEVSGEVRKYEEDSAKFAEKKVNSLKAAVVAEEKILPIKKARAGVEEDIAAAMARQTADAAKQVQVETKLKSLKDQARADAIFAMTGGQLGAGDVQRGGSEALAMKLRQLQNELQVRNATPTPMFEQTSQFFGNLSLENDIAKIRAELDIRRNLTRDVERLGVEGARRRFDGDPLAFDRLVAEFATAKTEFAETNTLLRQLNERVRSGITVRPLGP